MRLSRALGGLFPDTEVSERVMGKSTMVALNTFQSDYDIAVNNKVFTESVTTLNRELQKRYCIYGYITTDYEQPVEGVKVKFSLEKDDTELGNILSLKDGSYRVYPVFPDKYKAPDGLLDFNLTIRADCYQLINTKETLVYNEKGLIIRGIQSHYNFSSDAFVFQGKSLLQRYYDILLFNNFKSASEIAYNEIGKVSDQTGISADDLIRLIFAEAMNMRIGKDITTNILFAILYQRLPLTVPMPLYTEEVSQMKSAEWEDFKNRNIALFNGGVIQFSHEDIENILSSAIYKNYIDFIDGATLANIISAFDTANRNNKFDFSFLAGDIALSDIINKAGTNIKDIEKKIDIAVLFVKYIDDFNGFIKELNSDDNKKKYDADNIKKLTRTFEQSRVTRNYIELITAIENDNTLKNQPVRYLATLPLSKWNTLISKYPTDFKTKAEYVNLVHNTLQKIYPDVAYIGLLEADKPSGFQKIGIIKTKLIENPEFNLLSDRIVDAPFYDQIKGDTKLMEELTEIQGVYRISATPFAGKTLFEGGIRGSAQVYFTGKRALEIQFSDTLTPEEIQTTYNMATARYTAALNAFSNINTAFFAGDPSGMQILNSGNLDVAIAELEDEFPNIATLFGEYDSCKCRHDVSVYSAAAYLADLLAFLKDRGVKKYLDTRGGIMSNTETRRKDISLINLNEKNTNTMLPYIDLVCEMLEEAVLKIENSTYERDDEDCQTTWNSDELAAAPERVLSIGSGITAYDIIGRSIYPMYAPFDLFLTESREFLKKMGINRFELMELFKKENDSINSSIAAEYFGLTVTEEDIVTGKETVAWRNKAWNINNWTVTGDFVSVEVENFMSDSGLSLDNVLDLVEAKWVKISNENFTGDCSMREKPIEGDKDAFDRAHRFIRLWQKSDWKIWELNMLLKSILTKNEETQEHLLNADTFYNLYLFARQQNELNTSVEELLACYDMINTVTPFIDGESGKSLYERLFLNPAISNPPDDNLVLIGKGEVAVWDNLDELVAACLSMKMADYHLLARPFSSGNKPTLKYLSYLYRSQWLAKKCGLSISEYLRILTLIGKTATEPFDINGIDVTELLGYVNQIKQHGLSIAGYEYLTGYQYEKATPIPTEEEPEPPSLSFFLSEESAKLALNNKQIKDLYETFYNIIYHSPQLAPPTNIPDEDEDDEEILKIYEDYKNEFSEFVSQTGLYDNPDTIQDVIGVIECKKWWYKENGDLEDEIIIRKKIEALFPDKFGHNLDNIVNDLYPYETAEDVIERYEDIIPYYNVVFKINAFVEAVAEFYDSSIDYTNLYLEKITWDNEILMDILLDENNYPDENEEVDFEIKKIIILLHKIVMTVKSEEISLENLTLLFGIEGKIEFYWNKFVTASETPAILPTDRIQFLDLITLLKWIDLQSNFGKDEKGRTLLSIIKDEREQNLFIKALSQLARWDHDNFIKLIEHFNWGSLGNNAINPVFYKPDTYYIIIQCFAMQNVADISMATLAEWRIRDNSQSTNAAITSALRRYLGNSGWIEEMPAVQKPIREGKSNALASFLIVHEIRVSSSTNPPTIPRWRDRIDLYGYFLIDTEMSACMKTSRIVQATSSVQLFVQRAMLNLEKDVVINRDNDTNWLQWDWMKKYRLWEANRKVFLYPENWIEPELRDNKSSFFKELEDEINQSDMSEELADAVFENYLQKVDEVSNLIVIGTCHEEVNGDDGVIIGKDTLYSTYMKRFHVIARSRQAPYQYYYRYYDGFDKSWTWWEKIELEIKGDVAVPILFNRRLYLFWFSVQKKTIEIDDSGEYAGRDYSEIQLEWGILKNNKWAGPYQSQKKIVGFQHYSLEDYSIIAKKWKNNLIFQISRYDRVISQGSIPIGYFIFDGDVYSSLNVLNVYNDIYFPQNVTYINNTILNAISNIRSIYCNGNHFVSSQNYTYFDQYISTMEPENRPDPILFINTGLQNFKVTTPSILPLSSRYYPTEINGQRSRTLYANKNTNLILLHTKNEMPNHICMIHNNTNAFNISSPYAYRDYFAFYQDGMRNYYITPPEGTNPKYHFWPFYHPYTKLLIIELMRGGIPGLMNRYLQDIPDHYSSVNTFNFSSEYTLGNSFTIETEYNKEIMDFSHSGAYSEYNWEIFFHAPLYIACKLSQDQKYEEAMSWFHYIFNPMDQSDNRSPQKFWITKPFFRMTTPENRLQQIRNILRNIQNHTAALTMWLNNPYNPHLVARTRIVAFQRTVVMKYLDNLIAWGDQLFRQDSIESNNEAAQLYILAYEILGRRPIMLPEQENGNEFNYNDLTSASSFSMEAVENEMTFAFSSTNPVNIIADTEYVATYRPGSGSGYDSSDQSLTANRAVSTNANNESSSAYMELLSQEAFVSQLIAESAQQLPRIDAVHFCIPYNDQLLGYWDTVEDRLFKLRNCMNIEGIVRELPLFEPPIDPAMLVKAMAAGLSIGEALQDITGFQPYYRFRTILQKAIEFTGEIKQLGDKLLSALEKKDAEILSLLRSTQEITLQNAMKQIRKLQIDEANANIENLNKLIETTVAKRDYYANKKIMNSKEDKAYNLSIDAANKRSEAAGMRLTGKLMTYIPDFDLGISGFAASPVIKAILGGSLLSEAFAFAADIKDLKAMGSESASSQLSTMANYERRKEEWNFQVKMASMELVQLNKQVTAAVIRRMIAEKELANLELQIEQSQSVKEYYEDKYTNQALYNWMITQTSSVYFQAYKLAYDMAKKAELCYRHELGIYSPTSFIQFGYWDSLKKGLLSGERLIYDLHRLDAAYLEQNKRTLELTKHVSLAQMFPELLEELIAEKAVTLNLEEFLFDMDYPGHYMRRIKSVSVTIPNVAGPYTTVSFMLTLQNAKVRKDPNSQRAYEEEGNLSDSRFVYQSGGNITQSICTSSAQNDSGLFELNFGDERYLPFENAGAISTWRLDLAAGCEQFDLSSISDVILHINYTSKYDGGLREKAEGVLIRKLPTSGKVMFSLKNTFPDAWNQMDGTMDMNFALDMDHLPYFLRGRANDMKIEEVVILAFTGGIDNESFIADLQINDDDDNEVENNTTAIEGFSINLNRKKGQDIIPYYGKYEKVEEEQRDEEEAPSFVNEWKFKIEDEGISPSDIEDVIIALTLNIPSTDS